MSYKISNLSSLKESVEMLHKEVGKERKVVVSYPLAFRLSEEERGKGLDEAEEFRRRNSSSTSLTETSRKTSSN